MNSFSFSQNKYLIFGSLIALVLIFFMGRSYGKTEPPKAIDIDGQTDTDGYLVSTITDREINLLTDRLYKDLDGIHWIGTSRDEELWYKIVALSDRDLARIVNNWSKNYYSKHKEKLSEAIEDDYFSNLTPMIEVLVTRIKNIENY